MHGPKLAEFLLEVQDIYTSQPPLILLFSLFLLLLSIFSYNTFSRMIPLAMRFPKGKLIFDLFGLLISKTPAPISFSYCSFL